MNSPAWYLGSKCCQAVSDGAVSDGGPGSDCHSDVHVLVSGVGIVEEEATIESSKSLDEAEAGRPQEALDLVGPELAMTKSNGAFWAAWGALVVDGW